MSAYTRFSRWGAALICGATLAACATLIGPRQVELPQTKLQQNLDRKFPVHQRVLGVLELELSHPQLAIMAENDRVSLSLEVQVTPLLARQNWQGTMVLSGRLKVDTARNTVYLSDAHVDRFAMRGMDEGKQNQVVSVANLLAESSLRDVPVHTFRPDELRYGGVQFVLTGISTRPGALVANVQPAQ